MPSAIIVVIVICYHYSRTSFIEQGTATFHIENTFYVFSPSPLYSKALPCVRRISEMRLGAVRPVQRAADIYVHICMYIRNLTRSLNTKP
jgi:hypothetical protein